MALQVRSGVEGVRSEVEGVLLEVVGVLLEVEGVRSEVEGPRAAVGGAQLAEAERPVLVPPMCIPEAVAAVNVQQWLGIPRTGRSARGAVPGPAGVARSEGHTPPSRRRPHSERRHGLKQNKRRLKHHIISVAKKHHIIDL